MLPKEVTKEVYNHISELLNLEYDWDQREICRNNNGSMYDDFDDERFMAYYTFIKKYDIPINDPHAHISRISKEYLYEEPYDALDLDDTTLPEDKEKHGIVTIYPANEDYVILVHRDFTEHR